MLRRDNPIFFHELALSELEGIQGASLFLTGRTVENCSSRIGMLTSVALTQWVMGTVRPTPVQ